MNNTNSKQFFGNAYLMLTSVIQATAFGFFLATLKVMIDDGSFIIKIPFIITEFLTIVTLSYGYLLGARDVWWHFDGVDVLIPFLLGLWEILAILVLQNSKNPYASWFVFYLLFMTTGIGAIFHGVKKISSIPNDDALFIHKDEQQKRQKWFFWVIAIQFIWCISATILTQYAKIMQITFFLGVIQMFYFLMIFVALVKKDRHMFEQNAGEGPG